MSIQEIERTEDMDTLPSVTNYFSELRGIEAKEKENETELSVYEQYRRDNIINSSVNV
jgi:hypothetical protein